MKVIIELDTNNVTEKDRSILAFFAGEVNAPKVEVADTAAPKKAPKKAVIKDQDDYAKVIAGKPTVAEVEEAKKVEVKEDEVVEDAVDGVEEVTLDMVKTYAIQDVKPEYAPHYAALLKELGVNKFSEIKQEDLKKAYAKLKEIKETVVV